MIDIKVICVAVFLPFVQTGKIADAVCRNGTTCCIGHFRRNDKCLVCPRGTHGTNCSNLCPRDFYGLLCTMPCNCTDNEICHPEAGCLKITENIPTHADNTTMNIITITPKQSTPYTLNIKGQRFSLPQIVIISLLLLIIILITVNIIVSVIRLASDKSRTVIEKRAIRRQSFNPNSVYLADEWSNDEQQAGTHLELNYRSLADENAYSNFGESSNVE